MKSKATLKIVIDLAMTAALLFLMGYQFWSDTAHEWAGAGMFVLFIAHHILNRGWYKALFKGKYTPARCFQLAVSLLLLLAMLGLMVSGIMLSRHVFDFLNISGGMAFGRLLHIVCVHWGFVLMAMHLGLHWNMVMNRIRKAAHVKENSCARRTAFRIAGALIAVWGFYQFIHRNFLTYMFLQAHFVFLDYEEPIFLFYLNYLAMMGFFIFVAHYVSGFLKRNKKA